MGLAPARTRPISPEARSDWGPLPSPAFLPLSALVMRQALAKFFFFRASFAFFLFSSFLLFLFFFSFFLSFVLSFVLSFFRSFFLFFFLSFFLFLSLSFFFLFLSFLAFFLFLLGAQLSSGLSFSCLSPGRPRVRAGPGVCVGDAPGVSGSPDFPARLRVLALACFLAQLSAPLVAGFVLLSLALSFRLLRRRVRWLAAFATGQLLNSSAGRASACFSSSNRFFSARFSACRATRVACTAER